MKSEKNFSRPAFLYLVVAFLSLWAAVTTGAVSIPGSSILNSLFGHATGVDSTIVGMRLVRFFTGFAVGALLGLCGSVLQRLLANPLADPYVLGISAGGTTVAVVSSFVELPAAIAFLPTRNAAAFVGCLGTLALLLMARKRLPAAQDTYALPVLGLILNAFFGAIIMIVFAVGGHPNSAEAYRWLIGSLQDNGIFELSVLAAVCVLPVIFLFQSAPAIQAMSFGSDFAESIGFDAKKTSTRTLIFVTILISCAVSLSGSIGFVGLIVPHMARKIHRDALRHEWVASMMLGGICLSIADTFSRTLIAPVELPVGIFTACVGVPALAFLLFKRRVVRVST